MIHVPSGRGKSDGFLYIDIVQKVDYPNSLPNVLGGTMKIVVKILTVLSIPKLWLPSPILVSRQRHFQKMRSKKHSMRPRPHRRHGQDNRG
jgi:hypothetical protein